ncbi:MAG TPA: hypothetical protein VEV62_09960 [Parafilimonas sp.]|nr:hypothetical protein [Parafilimonas sp.]
MDRPITTSQKKPLLQFDSLDLFPYTIALLMFAAEIYIIHQFVVLTPMMQYLH